MWRKRVRPSGRRGVGQALDVCLGAQESIESILRVARTKGLPQDRPCAPTVGGCWVYQDGPRSGQGTSLEKSKLSLAIFVNNS